MSETPITYAFGTGVWVKVVNRYWWPGIVVDPLTVPDELLEFVKKVNTIAVVKFEQENKYEVVLKKGNILLYSCDRKMEFVEKGLTLLRKQKKGEPLVGKFNMDNFRYDVISMEKRIGGDICIFENLEEKQETMKTFVKQLFTPTNTKKSKKKEVGRKSLPVPIPKSKPQPISTPVFKQQQKPSSQSKFVNHLIPSKISQDNYACQVQVGCPYTTNRYANLKQHMAMHKSNTDQKMVKKSPSSTSNKRKNLKTKLSDNKKIKLQEELLKDWENEGDDEDVELNTINVQSTSQVVETINQVRPIENEGVQITSEVVPIKNEGLQITSEVAPTMTEDMSTGKILSSENDLTPTFSEVIPITNEIQETNTVSPNKVFEFNENDDNTPVVELRQNKLDSSSTVVDDIIEKSKPEVISDFLNNAIPDASTNESLVVEETKKDSFNETREIHSNEIDDQAKNADILLEKTVNTLDQINCFENSLSCISNSINKSDANILTEDNNVVIGISDFIDCESLKEPTSANKNNQIEMADLDDMFNIVSTTDNREIAEQRTIKKAMVLNNEEVNQSNGTAIDKDLPIVNTCSIDSVSNKMEIETTKEKDNQKCLLDSVHAPEYFKEDGWETFAHNGIDKAKQFAVDSKKTNYLSECQSIIIESRLTDTSFETKFKSEINEMSQSDIAHLNIEFMVPCNLIEYQTLQELNASSVVQSSKRVALNLNPINIHLQSFQN